MHGVAGSWVRLPNSPGVFYWSGSWVLVHIPQALGPGPWSRSVGTPPGNGSAMCEPFDGIAWTSHRQAYLSGRMPVQSLLCVDRRLDHRSWLPSVGPGHGSWVLGPGSGRQGSDTEPRILDPIPRPVGRTCFRRISHPRNLLPTRQTIDTVKPHGSTGPHRLTAKVRWNRTAKCCQDACSPMGPQRGTARQQKSTTTTNTQTAVLNTHPAVFSSPSTVTEIARYPANASQGGHHPEYHHSPRVP